MKILFNWLRTLWEVYIMTMAVAFVFLRAQDRQLWVDFIKDPIAVTIMIIVFIGASLMSQNIGRRLK